MVRCHHEESGALEISSSCCQQKGGIVVKSIIIDKLFDSLQELDRAIATARKTFERRSGTPEGVLSRLNHYQQMLDKQRALVIGLCDHANSGNWSEVNRHIRLINGLSQMIRDDAREMLNQMEVPVPGFAAREMAAAS